MRAMSNAFPMLVLRGRHLLALLSTCCLFVVG
jgi:hypothetical protein